jgi:membrane protease YdiL (CAAX protease family)
MNAKSLDRKSTIRNLFLFIVAINILGWLGWMFAQDGTADAQGLGMLIWLGSPLLVAILLRLFSKDWTDIGIKPNFKSNGKWYVVSFVAFPVIVAIVLLIGALFGGVSLTNFNVALFVQVMAVAFISTFIKNIFEEFAWRGFLTPKVDSLGVNAIGGHLFVGFIWGTWHIPYYLGLIDSAQISAYTSQNLLIFIPLAIISMTLAGIFFGEMRLITGSTWPAVLMHTVSNIVIITLLIDGYAEVSDKTEILFTPSWEGIVSMILITLAGLWLYRQRMQST